MVQAFTNLVSLVSYLKVLYYDKKLLLEKAKMFSYDDILSLIESNILSLQIRIFNESLNIYKLYNDEPIWVDSQDTLNVIKWVVNKI